MHTLGIPHPPGTPMFVALGHVWSLVLGPALGVARAVNLLSAVCTAASGAGMAWLIARRCGAPDGGWIGLTSALAAGTMMSVWSNATETEVYAIALLHAVAMLLAASRAGDDADVVGGRWGLLTAYLIALAPAVHLSALVAAPAAIVLATSGAPTAGGRSTWQLDRLALLSGALIIAAGVGSTRWVLVAAGCGVALLPFIARRSRRDAAEIIGVLLLIGIATTALLMLLVRARHDPAINQGNPASISALIDVVGRRQYDVSPMFPRQAPVWLQLVNVLQYVDWQVAMSWGRGLMTSPQRVIATLAWLAVGTIGFRAMRREARTLANAMGVLFVAGTVGVAAYLNLKAGASLGWGILADSAPHEARERDYFFVLGFWAWGCLAGYGAIAIARARAWPLSVALVAVALPLVGNWPAADRRRAADGRGAGEFAMALLEQAPRNSVMFLDGDNDSYPLWYAQHVEHLRRDVLTVTVPLLPADWYLAELVRRSGLSWSGDQPVRGARTRSEQRAALLAEAARQSGRPVVASPAVPERDRSLLGASWAMVGPVYVSRSGRSDATAPVAIDSSNAMEWLGRLRAFERRDPPPADNVADVMLGLLQCPRLALRGRGPSAQLDSLEVRCNRR